MKVLGATIEGFRAVTERVTIDLSADITILVGPNGTGKTSLLDALLWSMTGRLGRIGKTQERVLSLYAPAGLARVSIELEDTAGAFSVVRTLLDGADNVAIRTASETIEGPQRRPNFCAGSGTPV